MTIKQGSRVLIEVSQIEYVEGGNTLWVHGPKGTTVFRLKLMGGVITSRQCATSPDMGSHGDLIVRDDLHMCLGDDAGVSE